MNPSLYLEHLNDADILLLASIESDSRDRFLAALRNSPEHLEEIIAHPALYEALFVPGSEDVLLRASPFLVFAVLIHRATRELSSTGFIQEWIGPGRRVPMFEVAGLREFASHPMRRLFLAELLASYTHVSSGSVWVQTVRGWRRRRFSELDPLRLLELLETAPEVERPAIYRRLGDLALFLTGVFPDYAGIRLLPNLKRQRLQRVLRWEDPAGGAIGGIGDIGLLEHLGSRSYHMAWRATDSFATGSQNVLEDVAEGFGHARRMLNFVTDRYMFPLREQWFPLSN